MTKGQNILCKLHPVACQFSNQTPHAMKTSNHGDMWQITVFHQPLFRFFFFLNKRSNGVTQAMLKQKLIENWTSVFSQLVSLCLNPLKSLCPDTLPGTFKLEYRSWNQIMESVRNVELLHLCWQSLSHSCWRNYNFQTWLFYLSVHFYPCLSQWVPHQRRSAGRVTQLRLYVPSSSSSDGTSLMSTW